MQPSPRPTNCLGFTRFYTYMCYTYIDLISSRSIIIILPLLLLCVCLYREREIVGAMVKPSFYCLQAIFSVLYRPLFFWLSCDNISVDKYTRTLIHITKRSGPCSKRSHRHRTRTHILPQWIGGATHTYDFFSLQWKWIEFSILAKSSYLKLKSYSLY